MFLHCVRTRTKKEAESDIPLGESSRAKVMEDGSINRSKFYLCIVAYLQEEGCVKKILYLTVHVRVLMKPHGPYRIHTLEVSRCPVVGSPL
jgi:hypothetical protein